jgi:P-type Ca2+ transporter type 2C
MQGLTENEATLLLKQFGKNALFINPRKRLLRIIWDMVKEPMFLLLLVACGLYFILRENTEGFMMAAALFLVSAISVFQEIKSSNALASLQQLTEPKVKVARDGIEKEIDIELLVPGDIILLEEGAKVPADAIIKELNDLSINESIIMGESMPVDKTIEEGSNVIFQGTVVNSGRCTALVTATGEHTTLGKIGKSIITYSETKTELQQQVDSFFKAFSFFGIAAFFLVFFINYFQDQIFVTSILFGLTLAMSVIPEEIPVAFTSFMALGAYHMSKLGIITRQPQTIENLGPVNIVCLDKTGTITRNRMIVESVYDHRTDSLLKPNDAMASGVLYYGMLASEQKPFDAMEKAIVEAYEISNPPLPAGVMANEYPLEGHPPMMTHVYQNEGHFIVAGKGGIERIIRVCKLSANES